MEPLSIVTGAVQIIGFCTQCTVSIVKWVGEVRTVNERIASFCDEVNTLQGTYEGLEKTLRSQRMAEAAKSSARSPDGAFLWAQLHTALKDSKSTMLQVNVVLNRIDNAQGFGRPIKKQLLESLKSGELSRLHRRINFFNANLSFPIQMVMIMLQLEQRDVAEEHQRQLDSKLVSIEREMRRLVRSLDSADRSSMTDATTLVAVPADKDSEQIKDYVSFAKKFLSTASAAASTRSAASSGPDHPVDDVPQPFASEHPLLDDRRTRINDWVGDQGPSEAQSSSAPTHPTDEASEMSDSDSEENDVEFWLRHASLHLKVGQEKAEQNDFESAGKCFRKVLDLMQRNDFGDRLALQPADVILMLSACCVKQGEVDEAINLLEPVSSRKEDIYPMHPSPSSPTKIQHSTNPRPNRLQALAASHMIGEAYLLKGDHDNAELYVFKAFKSRESRLGERHAKTLESAQLLINIHKAKGDDEEAEIYSRIVNSTVPVVSSPDPASQRGPPRLPIRPSPTLPTTQPDRIRTHSEPYPKIPTTSRWPFSRSSQQPTSQPQASYAHRNSQSSISPIPKQATISDDRLSQLHPYNSPLASDHRKFSWPSSTSTPERNSLADDSPYPDSLQLERSSGSSQAIDPVFSAVQQLCTEKKYKMAVKRAIGFMKNYNKSHNILLVRQDELTENIKKGGSLGLSATGHGYSPLHFFTEIRDPECVDEVRLLIRNGVDVNAVAYKASVPGTNPLTALQIAVREGHSNIVRSLLSVPTIRTFVKDSEGFAPLLVACRRSYYDIVIQLLDHYDHQHQSLHPSNPLPLDLPVTWYGNSLLHDAARQCDSPLVSILLERSHEIDGRDKFGRTPLHYAVIKKDITNLEERRRKTARRDDVVKLLLDDGADRKIVDAMGMTAMDYAKEEGEGGLELASLLKAYTRSAKMAELQG